MLEKEIEQKVRNYARKKGWWVRKFTAPGRKAVPDRIFAKGGTVIFMEFKAPGKKPTKLQEIEHELMRQAGLQVEVVDDPWLGLAILERADIRRPPVNIPDGVS